ncbi:MAG: YfaZ family outer membrane protein [Desulfobacterales bacterium]|jgi:hypothetical protein
MIKCIKFATVVFLMMLLAPVTTQAADTSVELNVNDSDFEARFDTLVNPFATPLTVGAGFLYGDDDDFWLANVNVAVKDEVGAPGLNLGLGFKGIFGDSDVADDDFTTGALAFQFLAEYDFRESTANLPVSITASLGWAPEILSFSDTEDYFEFYSAVYLHINYWASIFIGYRDIEIEYENDIDVEGEYDAFYFGAKLSF